MHDLLNVILLGIIEGITEFLPISCTGHLLIAERWLGARSDLFNVGIQAGAILAVTLIYWRRIWHLLTSGAIRRPRLPAEAGRGVPDHGGAGPGRGQARLQPARNGHPGGLGAGDRRRVDARRRTDRRTPPGAARITWTVAILVGIAQMVAGIFPGTSRSAATIFAAMLFGTNDRPAATEFAFLVGIPTMYAATGYELLKRLRDGRPVHGLAGTGGRLHGVAAGRLHRRGLAAALHPQHRFTPFAIYRIVLGIVLLVGRFAGIGPCPMPADTALLAGGWGGGGGGGGGGDGRHNRIDI